MIEPYEPQMNEMSPPATPPRSPAVDSRVLGRDVGGFEACNRVVELVMAKDERGFYRL